MTDLQAKRITRNLLIQHFARMDNTREVIALYRVLDGKVWIWSFSRVTWVRVLESVDQWKFRISKCRFKMVQISCEKAYAIQRKRVIRLQEKLKQWLKENR